MLWAMLGTMAAIWAVIAIPFAVVVAVKRRNRARKGGWTDTRSNAPGAFYRLHGPAKSPPGINPKTGSPF
jgi:hypothetical protein